MTIQVPVVAIGAAAGGSQAFTQLLQRLSPNTGMADVYMQRIDPADGEDLIKVLSKHSPMPVVLAQDAIRIEADHVYILPPGEHMVVEDGLLLSRPRPASQLDAMPIDQFFNSLAKRQKEAYRFAAVGRQKRRNRGP